MNGSYPKVESKREHATEKAAADKSVEYFTHDSIRRISMSKSEFPQKLYVTVNHNKGKKINCSRSIKRVLGKWRTDYKDIARVAEYKLVDDFRAKTVIRITRP